MIRTIDFNSLPAGTVIDDEYAALGVTVSAAGGSGQAMIFDSANPTGGDNDLASDKLQGLLIISEDGDSSDPDDNACGGSLFFDFDDDVRMKAITFKDIEETGGAGTRIIFYAEDGSVIDNHFVQPTGDGGESTVQLNVPGVHRVEVRLEGSGAIDNVVFDDNTPEPNEDPDAVDDLLIMDEDTSATVAVLGNDSDPDGDALTVTEATSPDGTVSIGAGGVLTFTPSENFNGPTTISYTISDGNGGTDTATVNVEVCPINDVPVAVDDAESTPEDTAVIVDLIGNDTDVDGDALSLVTANVPADQGSLVDNGDGTVTFTPAPDFNGEATITYTVRDPGGLTDEGQAIVNVTPVGDAPVTAPDTLNTDEDTLSAPLNVLDNDSDPDGDPLTLTEADSPDGSVRFTPEGEVVFTPNPDFNGTTTISYTVRDPEGNETPGIVNVTVNPINDAPDAVDDADSTPEDTPITVNLLANDTDVDGDTLSVVSASVPADQGSLVDNGDGTVTFTPAENFNGDATITYTISDPDGLQDTAEHVITVTPLNDAPVANDDAQTTPFNTAVTIPVVLNDTDVDGDPLSVTTATSPDGTVEISPDGQSVIFTPTDGFEGDATINYTVSDPDGLTDDAVVTVTVTEDPRDGYVDGDDEGNLIDEDYLGDPDGDLIDNDDALLPGTEGDDDYVRAGGGDDTVEAGQGNDTVEGGDGDDLIDTSNGDLAPDLGYPFAATDPLGYDPDADPENDRDSVDGGDGNDTITTGDDRDTITGGDGLDVIDGGIDDDLIDGGADDDRIVGGEGNDSILGGSGNDTIYAGNDPDLGLDVLDIPDEPTPGNPFSPDRNPDNGRDTVDGGAGDDVIFGADDDDVLRGGSGNDLLDGQIDDDTLSGNTGEDTLIGGQGDDSLSGGQGDDTLEGGTGDDTLRGNRDDDLLQGGAGNDSLDGGGQDDTLEGGAGDDNMMGGQGDDLLDGGDGNDTMTGGAGQDTFVNVNAGDDVDGGSGPVDFDTLDLRGSAPDGGRLEVEYTSPDREDGIVRYFDEDNNPAGELVFEEIENVIPCFTPGTRIATPKGERRVEDLQVGDRVITRDNGIQEIRWVGARDLTGAELERAAHLKPVLIRQGALGNDLPERDMMVSPNHRVLVANDKTALYFEEREVLVAAKHLTGLEGVDIVDVSHTTYIHVMFDQHEVILSDGAWTESFQPGDMSLAGIGNAQRQEILELFPELATQDGIEGYASARRSLKKHEAKLLTK